MRDPDVVEPFLDLSIGEAVALAEAHDTPLFVYDEPYFETRVRGFRDQWAGWFPTGTVYLSYKTNYMPQLCRTAHQVGLGADVVSGYELEHALRLGAAKTVFNGPLKRRHELERAAVNGVGINVDLPEELDILAGLHGSGAIPEPRLGLRVNPGRPVYTSADTSFLDEHRLKQRTGKFGWPIEGGFADRMADGIAAAGFTLRMVHAHLNSQITRADRMVEALGPVLAFVRRLKDRGVPVEELNVGGGFGVPGMVRAKRGWWGALKQSMGEPMEPEEPEAFDLNVFCGGLRRELERLDLLGLEICCEPGRYLFSPSMTLLTRVIGLKAFDDKTWLLLDAGLHILPTASFGETRRLRFLDVGAGREHASDDLIDCAIGGPLCYEGDVVMASAKVPRGLKSGDLVLISDAGAYTVSRSTNFNQPRAAVALRDGQAGRIIWRRETYDDIFAYAT
ncbi:MAG: hypothetical protein NXI16_03850 [Alphaproteobacteria bacterium]|nr:hypothetical protein [Alphaproteobacteria bacterium]